MTAYTHGHLTQMIDKGSRFAFQNLSMWHTDEDSDETVPPLEILDKICPEDCNDRGACVDGIY